MTHQHGKLTFIFEDQHLAVLSKPAGLLSQGEITGDENLVDLLRVHFGRNYVGLVHRLDRNTSGIMVVAKRTKSAQRLTDALQSGRMKRTYLAWVEGELRGEVVWRHHLLKDEKKNLVRVHPSGSEAVLRARPIRAGKWKTLKVTLIELELETGRSHQIRVQAAHEGYPLLGDVKYGSGTEASRSFGRPALHSHRLSFPHPMPKEGQEEVLHFEAPLPEDMTKPK